MAKEIMIFPDGTTRETELDLFLHCTVDIGGVLYQVTGTRFCPGPVAHRLKFVGLSFGL